MPKVEEVPAANWFVMNLPENLNRPASALRIRPGVLAILAEAKSHRATWSNAAAEGPFIKPADAFTGRGSQGRSGRQYATRMRGARNSRPSMARGGSSRTNARRLHEIGAYSTLENLAGRLLWWQSMSSTPACTELKHQRILDLMGNNAQARLGSVSQLYARESTSSRG